MSETQNLSLHLTLKDSSSLLFRLASRTILIPGLNSSLSYSFVPLSLSPSHTLSHFFPLTVVVVHYYYYSDDLLFIHSHKSPDWNSQTKMMKPASQQPSKSSTKHLAGTLISESHSIGHGALYIKRSHCLAR